MPMVPTGGIQLMGGVGTGSSCIPGRGAGVLGMGIEKTHDDEQLQVNLEMPMKTSK